MTDSPVSAYDAAVEAMARVACADNRNGTLYESELPPWRRSMTAALDKLLAARGHATCPTCGGHGHGAEQYAERGIGFSYPTCPTCDGSGSVPGGSLLLAVMVEKGLLEGIGEADCLDKLVHLHHPWLPMPVGGFVHSVFVAGEGTP